MSATTGRAAPAGLFAHPAWLEWKSCRGWTRLDAGPGIRLLGRRLPRSGYMARGAADLGVLGASHPFRRNADELGAALEDLTRRALHALPSGCAFIRWEVAEPAWLDAEGYPLSVHLQELRMNASTASRRFRKAAVESLPPDTVLVDLGDGDALWTRMEGRTRHAVGLARRRGTRVARAGADGVPTFARLHSQTARRHGIQGLEEAGLRDLFLASARHGLGLDLYVARSGDQPAAAAVVANDGRDAWYLLAASSLEHREAAGPSAILHRAMLDCSAAGLRTFDLMGVGPRGAEDHPLAGLSRFKTGFGGTRFTRAGTWDFVLRPDLYARHSREEAIRSIVPRPAPD